MNKFQFNALMIYAIDRDMIDNFSVLTVLFSAKYDSTINNLSLEEYLKSEVLEAYNQPWKDYGKYNKFIAKYGNKLNK